MSRNVLPTSEAKSFVIGLFILSFLFVYLIFGIPGDYLTNYADQGRNLMLEFFATYLGFGISFILLARYFLLMNRALLFIGLAFFSICLSDIIRTFGLQQIDRSVETFVFFSTISYGFSKSIFVFLLFWSSLFIETITPRDKVKKECFRLFTIVFLLTCVFSGTAFFLLPKIVKPDLTLNFQAFSSLLLASVYILISLLTAYRYYLSFYKRQNHLALWFTIAIVLSILNDVYSLMVAMASAFTFNFGLLFRILSSTAFGVGVIDDYVRYLLQERETATHLEREVVQRTEELERKNRELEIKSKESLEASRLKSELLANMSHELRTPMNAIIGFTNRVIKKSNDTLPERQLKNLKTVEKNAHHLLGLINSILDVSKVEAGKMEVLIEPFELEELIREVVDLSLPLIGNKNLKLLYECPPKLYINSDRTKLKQMLINLVSNSFKFTEEGGVKIAVKRAAINPFLALEKKKNEQVFARGSSPEKSKHHECIKIAVSDTGIGIKKENLKYIFDEFRQVDGSLTRETGGTGLGLSIVQKFSVLLGGGVEVDSEYKKGTCFTITLPINSSFAQRSTEKRGLKRGDEQDKRGSFLCLSDNERMLLPMRRYLNESSFVFESANLKDDAVTKSRAIRPALMTVDMTMKKNPFLDFMKDLKLDTFLRETPFLFFAMDEKKRITSFLEIDEYIVKPYSQQTLLHVLKKALVSQDIHRILFVEQDTKLYSMVSAMMETEGISVEFSLSREDALSKVRTMRPDIVFLDWSLPNMEAVAFLDERKKMLELDNITIVVVFPDNISDADIKVFQDKFRERTREEGVATEKFFEHMISLASRKVQ